jgi:hypothetical protein
VMRDRESLYHQRCRWVFGLLKRILVRREVRFWTPEETLKKSAVKKSAVSTAVHNDE